MAAKLKITLRRSPIGYEQSQRETARSLRSATDCEWHWVTELLWHDWEATSFWSRAI